MTPSTPSGRRDTARDLLYRFGAALLNQEGPRVRTEQYLKDMVGLLDDLEAEAGREAVEAYRLDLAEKVRAMTGLGITGHLVPRAAMLRLIEGEPHADPE